MVCKGTCEKYKVVRPCYTLGSKVGHYIVGNKRCSVCDIFLRWDGIKCPCCHTLLRVSSRNPRHKSNCRKTKKTLNVTVIAQVPTKDGIRVKFVATQNHLALTHIESD